MQGWPIAAPGQVIGLLGGSFDPPHQGHVHISLTALKRFNLDRLWWLVTPGNPLKTRGPAPLTTRVAQAHKVMQHPRVAITTLEAQLGTRYTAETLRALQNRYRDVRFVWLMGADNLAQFHLWQDWHWIMQNVPVGVLARPGDRIAARLSKAADIYRSAQLPGRAAASLGRRNAPSWCFINMPMSSLSSTAIRAKGQWG